jgi:hypothetical protein
VVKNKPLFRLNFDIHNFNTPGIIRFHPVMTHLRMFQWDPTYAGIRIFSYLLTNIKDLSNNVEHFKKALKEFLHMHLFILLMNFLCVKLDKQLYFNLVQFYVFLLFYCLYVFYVVIIIVILLIIGMYLNSLYYEILS